MNRLFSTLRSFVEKPRPEAAVWQDALPGFDNRIEVLCRYAERASAYEDDLQISYDEVMDQLSQLQGLMEVALDEGQDAHALEYLRLAARLRPQRDLLAQELAAFRSVADDLISRTNALLDNIDEARTYARTVEISPAATYYLDATLSKLTRYFVMLERIAISRHRALPKRLANEMLKIVDDAQLDLELATFILSRRRALGSG
jgi:hypothetical protein